MSAMLEEVYKEADVRIMGGDSVASTTQTIKVGHFRIVSTRSLSDDTQS